MWRYSEIDCLRRVVNLGEIQWEGKGNVKGRGGGNVVTAHFIQSARDDQSLEILPSTLR